MSAKIDWLHHESMTKANFCDTCCHQYSDICGTCETLEGVPVKYSEKKTNRQKFEEVFGYMPEVFNATKGTGLDGWWNQPYKGGA